MTHFQRIYTFLLLVSFPLIGLAQDVKPKVLSTLFDHWFTGDTSTIALKIHTDIAQLYRNPTKEVYQEAEVIATLADGEKETYQGKIRLRGNIRREICSSMPPLKLKFKKKEMTARGWLPHNDLKLVVPCRDNPSAVQDLIAEYITYQMYEKISPLSLRVQMIQIHMVDTKGKRKDRKVTAFIIEPIETMAARFELQEAERATYRESFLEKDLYRQMAFFEYMIGNTDWNVYNGHNLYFVAGSPFKRMVSIPYDFDYSAVVGTHYAVPYETLPIKSVTQRLYRGLSCSEEEALALIDAFGAKEEALLQPIKDNPMLTEGKRKEMLRFLDGFFKLLKKTKSLVWELKKG